jgi:hypothetical protein
MGGRREAEDVYLRQEIGSLPYPRTGRVRRGEERRGEGKIRVAGGYTPAKMPDHQPFA